MTRQHSNYLHQAQPSSAFNSLLPSPRSLLPAPCSLLLQIILLQHKRGHVQHMQRHEARHAEQILLVVLPKLSVQLPRRVLFQLVQKVISRLLCVRIGTLSAASELLRVRVTTWGLLLLLLPLLLLLLLLLPMVNLPSCCSAMES